MAEDGYAGCEVRVTPTRTEVIIRATRPRQVVGDQGRRVREITALVQKRFKYQQGQIILFAEKVWSIHFEHFIIKNTNTNKNNANMRDITNRFVIKDYQHWLKHKQLNLNYYKD